MPAGSQLAKEAAKNAVKQEALVVRGVRQAGTAARSYFRPAKSGVDVSAETCWMSA